jgi:uncharacterized protein YcfJ
MKHFLLACGACVASGAVLAQEWGTVLSATPVVQEVAVPRLVCQDQQVLVTPQRSGAGAFLGAVAGGVLGSTIGGGSGQAAAVAAGAVGGALLGNQVEAQPASQIQTTQNCSTQTFYQQQTAYYDVVYEYAGRRYQVQMANDPGARIALQVAPVGTLTTQPAPVRAPARIVSSTTYVQPTETVTVLPPATTVYQTEPVYSPPSYVAPLVIGVGLGILGGHLAHRHYGPPPRGYYGPRHGWRR